MLLGSSHHGAICPRARRGILAVRPRRGAVNVYESAPRPLEPKASDGPSAVAVAAVRPETDVARQPVATEGARFRGRPLEPPGQAPERTTNKNREVRET
jgi:hypothetical protein